MFKVIEQYLWDLLNFLYGFTGSYGWAIVLFAIIIKIVLYYPTHQQFKSMKEMQAIQPEIKKLQEKYKKDPKRMQQEQMLLFKKHKVNPLGGCLPLLIQLPILWGIWKAIMSHIDKFEKAFFLWIGSPLSKMVTRSFKPPFGGFAHPETKEKIRLYLISPSLASGDLTMLLLYAVSMYLSQKITVTDPATAKTQSTMTLMMPVFFTFILAGFPSALILYWLVFNILSIFQQILIMRQPATVAVAPTSGIKAEHQVTSGGKKI